MIAYPEKKSFLLDLDIDGKKYYIKFKQATNEETTDYHQILGLEFEKIKAYWLKIVKSSVIVPKWNIIKRRRILKTVQSQILEIIPILQNNIHKSYESVYNSLPKPVNKNSSGGKVVFDNTYSLITEQTMIPSDEISKRLTFEQMNRRLDKIIFEYYSTFDEGKRVNSMINDKNEKDRYKNIANMIDDNFN